MEELASLARSLTIFIAVRNRRAEADNRRILAAQTRSRMEAYNSSATPCSHVPHGLTSLVENPGGEAKLLLAQCPPTFATGHFAHLPPAIHRHWK